MAKEKSIKLNFIMNAILAMSSVIVPLITFPYVSRVLMPEGTGRVSFAQSWVMYFNMVAQLGIPTYGIRACARVRDDKEKFSKTVHELLFISLFMALAAYLALVVSLYTIPRLFEDRTLYFVVSLMIIFNAIGMDWMYKALEKYSYITIRAIVFKFISLVVMFVFVRKPSDYVIYGLVIVIAGYASYICNFLYAHKFVAIKFLKNYDVLQHVKPVLIFFGVSCANTIYTNLDTVMLGFWSTDENVGYYHAAVRIKSILTGLVTALGGVLLPRVSYYIEKKMHDEFKAVSKKALEFVCFMGTALTIYFMWFAPECIYFLAGNSYSGSILPMRVIMPTLALVGTANITGVQMLIPLGKEKQVLYSEIVGVVVDVIANSLLIPRYNTVGAAIGTLIAELAVLIVQIWALGDLASGTLKKIPWWKLLISIIAASGLSVWIKLLNIPNFFSLCFSAILFFGGFAVVLLVTRESLAIEMMLQIKGIVINKFGKSKKN